MSDENISNVENSKDPLDVFENTFQEFFGAADVTAVYDQPIHQGEIIVVPAAEVFGAMGFGIGSGSRDEKGNVAGGGGGGGGSVFSRPVAAIVITPTRVRIKPIVDVTKVALAALTAIGFMATAAMRMNRKSPPRFK
jgi:uncharacterized spore protein YtfJ